MKNKRLVISGLASAVAFTAIAGYAASDWRPGIMGMMGGHGMMGNGYQGQHMMQGKNMMRGSQGMMSGQMPMGMPALGAELDQLEEKLNLTGDQRALWEDFEAVAERQAASMLEHHQTMFQQFRSNQPMTLPERIDQHTQLMGQRFSSMTTYSNALKKLYQALDPQQQKLLDQNQFMGGM